ncbi:MAG: hypothetical protein R6X20_13660 [Phycisphaerae bacterium]
MNGLAAEVPELRRSSGNGMRKGTDSASGPARKKGHGIRMGAARRRQAGKLSNLGERRRWLSGYAVAFLVGAAVAAGAITLLFGDNADTEKTGTPAASRSLAQLLSNSPEELQGIDIGEMNLLCAEGLPGAEDLDVDRCLATLDRWADRVRRETERHLYRVQDPQYAAHYRNSEAYFRASMLLQVLQEDCGVHYNKERVRDIDFTNSRDLFLHGMVGSHGGGTCVSMSRESAPLDTRHRHDAAGGPAAGHGREDDLLAGPEDARGLAVELLVHELDVGVAAKRQRRRGRACPDNPPASAGCGDRTRRRPGSEARRRAACFVFLACGRLARPRADERLSGKALRAGRVPGRP